MSGGSTNRSAPEPARRRRRALTAGVAAAAVILGGVFFLNRDTETDPAAVQFPAPSQSPSPGPASSADGAGEATVPDTAADGGSTADPDSATDPAAEPGSEPGTQEPVTPDAASAPGPAAASDARLATQERAVAAPVEISAESSNTGGVDVRITAMEAVDGEAQGIGEVAGPAIRFTVSVTNNNADAVDLSNAVMTVESGADNAPCTPLSGPDAVPLPPSVDPGQSATGTYVFLIPVESRDLVTVYLSYSVDAPVAVFKGAVPTP